MTNRYTGEFRIVAHPDPNINEPIAELELSKPVFANETDAQSHVDTCGDYIRSDTFRLSSRFKESDSGFKHQLLMDIKGITPQDADVIVAARNELKRVLMAQIG
jgi:hypothetical protein